MEITQFDNEDNENFIKTDNVTLDLDNIIKINNAKYDREKVVVRLSKEKLRKMKEYKTERNEYLTKMGST